MKTRTYRSERKCRISLWIPTIVNDRLDADAKTYGITKTSIITTALIRYYSELDSSCREARMRSLVSSGKPAPQE